MSLSCPGGLLGRYQFCLCSCDLRSTSSGSKQVVLQSSMEAPLTSLLCHPGRGAASGPRHGYQGSTNTAPVTSSLASPVAKPRGQSSVLALPWLLGHSPLLPSFYLMVPTSHMQLLLFRGPRGSRHHFLCLPSPTPLVILTDRLYVLLYDDFHIYVSSADFCKLQTLSTCLLDDPLGNGLESELNMC